MAASILICSLCGLMLWIVWQLIRVHGSRDIRRGIPISTTSYDDKQEYAYLDIQPLQDFDWRTTSPIRNSPLKPKYHLTMALENITLSDIIAMDNTYVSRMQVRQSIMEDHPDATIQSTPVADKAVLELHDWMFRTYLPMRYPQIYYRQSGADGGLLNGVSNKIIPLSPSSAVEALRALGSNIDTDFLVLMPCSISPDGLPIYHLQAFVTCFPSGFSLRKKLGMPLAEIHTPVPGYKAKLEKSMDRFFARLECGKAVKRSNWGITTVTDLFLEGGTHFHNDKASDGPSSTSTEGDGPSTRVMDAIEQQKREVIVENCRLRSERQTLFRLPQSKAIVFSFKTYQYHLEDVKNDGYADELAAAIEGLVMGSVPEMNFYKRGVVWSEAVLQYLRS